MKFGLNFFPSFRPEQASTAEYFAQCLKLAQRADELGFNSIKTVEHYFHDYGGHSTNPSILLSAIAARTARIRLITGAVIPAFNHPIKLAGELAMLDNISQGRLDVGFGRAFLPEEYAAYGIDMAESRPRFEEGVQAIRRLWTEDRVSHQGYFWQFQNVHSMPRPLQKPHPPVWVAATVAEESFVYAARNGFHVMIVPFAGGLDHTTGMIRKYREVWRDFGHQPGAEQVQLSLHCYIAPDHDEAIRGFTGPMNAYLRVFGEAVAGWADRQSAQYPGYDKLVAAITSQTAETTLDRGEALVGTPDEVVARVSHYRELFGDCEPSMQVNFGGLPEEDALRTIELFAAKVMPAFIPAGMAA